MCIRWTHLSAPSLGWVLRGGALLLRLSVSSCAPQKNNPRRCCFPPQCIRRLARGGRQARAWCTPSDSSRPHNLRLHWRIPFKIPTGSFCAGCASSPPDYTRSLTWGATFRRNTPDSVENLKRLSETPGVTTHTHARTLASRINKLPLLRNFHLSGILK